MTYIVINTEMYQNIRILTKIYKVTTMTDRRTDGQTDRRTSRMKIMTYIVINTVYIWLISGPILYKCIWWKLTLNPVGT